jgi:hypothetical protein
MKPALPCIALLCLTATAVSAQQMMPFEPSLNNDTPTVVTQYDQDGKQAGTVTITGGRAYLRDKNGKHYATLIIDKDGTRRMVDPEGQPIDAAKIKRRLEEVK